LAEKVGSQRCGMIHLYNPPNHALQLPVDPSFPRMSTDTHLEAITSLSFAKIEDL